MHRALPGGPACAVGVVVLGSVTVMAIPVLGRSGLARTTQACWTVRKAWGLVLAGIVAVGVIAASAVTRRREAAQMDAGDVDGEDG
jgi:hypothetical protein